MQNEFGVWISLGRQRGRTIPHWSMNKWQFHVFLRLADQSLQGHGSECHPRVDNCPYENHHFEIMFSLLGNSMFFLLSGSVEIVTG